MFSWCGELRVLSGRGTLEGLGEGFALGGVVEVGVGDVGGEIGVSGDELADLKGDAGVGEQGVAGVAVQMALVLGDDAPAEIELPFDMEEFR